MHDITTIRQTEGRETVQVTFDDGRIFEGPKGSTIETFMKVAYPDNDPPVICCMANKQMRELTYHAETDLRVSPITLAESDGTRMYRRSLNLLLVAAAETCFPGMRITIGYGLNFGATYFETENHPPLTDTDIDALNAEMRRLVAADLPIEKERVPLDEVRRYFESKSWDDKLHLLPYRRKDYLTLYSINGVRDYLQGYMVPSTGYLQSFGLERYGDGYILRYPRGKSTRQLRPVVQYPKLVSVFDEYRDWMAALDVRDVGRLNNLLGGPTARELILVSEALHERRIARIGTYIAQHRNHLRLVLISGPSSSGKTTFSKRLAIQMRAHGLKLMTIGLDDFIVNRIDTPRDEEGDYDYESLHSLDLDLFNDVMLKLMAGETVTMPQYNFITGQREWGETLSVGDDYIFIIEGIHGLNPELVSRIPDEAIYRVYVSALTQLNVDNHNRVPTTDTRLLRRMVRDAAHRGYNATDTIMRWPKVRRGEHTWIFRYQEHADAMFNSALPYELAALKPLAEPLLLQVEPGKPAHRESKRLLSFLQWFDPLANVEAIPDNSILREFIGGSILRDYNP